jgi:hypothetical protein
MKKKCYFYITPNTKINSKWTNDLNASPKTTKLLEKNIGKKFFDIGFGNDLLDITPKAQATKTKINKWNYIKLRSFFIAKEEINKMNGHPTERETYL